MIARLLGPPSPTGTSPTWESCSGEGIKGAWTPWCKCWSLVFKKSGIGLHYTCNQLHAETPNFVTLLWNLFSFPYPNNPRKELSLGTRRKKREVAGCQFSGCENISKRMNVGDILMWTSQGELLRRLEERMPLMTSQPGVPLMELTQILFFPSFLGAQLHLFT